MNISLLRPLEIGPLTNSVTQWFGETRWVDYTPYGLAGHNGLDYGCPEGTPVRAAHDGVVNTIDEGAGGYGKYVLLNGNSFLTLYGHLSLFTRGQGELVKQGDVIGLSGSTGNSTGPHLHFGLKVLGMANPAYKNWVAPCPFRDISG